MKINTKTGLRIFDYNYIKAQKPCYDPIKYISKEWRGTVVTILQDERIPFADRLWCVLRSELISDRVMRLFAVWSYRQTLKFITNPDPRSVACADAAEKYANGLITKEELDAAKSAAWSAAAWSAAESAAAWSAAESAAASAAESAARSAAAASATAWSAATWSAAESAAWSAAESAAAWSAARNAQRDKLIEMCLAEGQERLAKRKKRES